MASALKNLKGIPGAAIVARAYAPKAEASETPPAETTLDEATDTVGGVAKPPRPEGSPSLPRIAAAAEARKLAAVVAGASSRLTAVVLVTVTLAYLSAEWLFLDSLLSAVADPATTAATADSLRMWGKLLAAFGMCWALGRRTFLTAALPYPAVSRPALFAAYVLGAFGLLTLAFDAVIDRLPDETKARSMAVAEARALAQRGDLDLPGLPTDQEARRLYWIAIGAAAADRSAWGMSGIVAHVKRAAETKIDAAVAEGWPRYDEAMSQVRAAFAAYKAAWTDLDYLPPFAQKRVREAIIKKTGGLPGGIKDEREFLERGLRESTAPEAAEARRLLDAVVAEVPGGTVYRGRDIPPFMTADGYVVWVGREKVKIAAALEPPTVEAVRKWPTHYRQAASAVVLPPLSAGLSALSILLNLGTLIVLGAEIAAERRPLPIGIRRVAAVAIPAAVVGVGYLLSPSPFAGTGLAEAEGLAGIAGWAAFLAAKGVALAGLLT